MGEPPLQTRCGKNLVFVQGTISVWLKRLRENQDPTSLVPQGRLNLAQDVVLGTSCNMIQSRRTADNCPGLRRGLFSAVPCGDWVVLSIRTQDYVLG
jgi:hypothetical protein